MVNSKKKVHRAFSFFLLFSFVAKVEKKDRIVFTTFMSENHEKEGSTQRFGLCIYLYV